VPTAPQNLQASPGNGQITLTWTAPSSNGGSTITAYKIYKGTAAGGEAYLAQVGGTTLTYASTGLTNGVTYYYKVTAVNAIGEGPFSNEASAKPGSAPTAPLGLVATGMSRSIKLTWSLPTSDGGSPITSWKIYRGTRSGGETLLTTVSNNGTTWTNTGLKAGSTYYYKVSAVNAIGESPQSNEATAKALSSTPLTSTPIALPPTSALASSFVLLSLVAGMVGAGIWLARVGTRRDGAQRVQRSRIRTWTGQPA